MTSKINIFHFPKAGGKSVRHQLQNKPNILLYYNSPMNKSALRCQLSEYKFKSSLTLTGNFSNANYNIAYGHFAFNNRFFKSCDAKNIILLRHPIDWTASMYFYWKKNTITATIFFSLLININCLSYIKGFWEKTLLYIFHIF